MQCEVSENAASKSGFFGDLLGACKISRDDLGY